MWCGLGAGLAFGLTMAALSVKAGEEKVPLDKLPQAVVQAVKTRFPDARMKSAGKETEAGQTVFEVTITNKGQNIDVTLSPAGTIVEIEKQIQASDLPRAVTEALQQKYPGARYEIIEEIIKVKDGKECLEYYEVLLQTAQKKKLEVAATPAGKLIKEEDKSKEKE
jgi:hypothetical protein